MRMKLLADSGSTKTEWVLFDDNSHVEILRIVSEGINPALMSEEMVLASIADVFSCNKEFSSASKIEFYGAGCTPSASNIVEKALRMQVGTMPQIIVGSDMIGAAKALCGDSEGIACILGTGANSCLWDGKMITMQTPALGYILGDEGGGAVMGRTFLNLIYKRGSTPFKPDGSINPLRLLRDEFENEYSVNMADVIRKVYREPNANRWLASLSPFIHSHLHVSEVSEMVVDNFRRFLRLNVLPYSRQELPVSFVGSVAYYYKEQLAVAVKAESLLMGKVLKSPLQKI